MVWQLTRVRNLRHDPQSPQRVQDYRHNNRLLQQCTLNRREIAQRRRDHAREGQPDPGIDTLQRDGADRRAISIPASRRSSRSTSRTTPAASALAAALRAPSATPRSAAARRLNDGQHRNGECKQRRVCEDRPPRIGKTNTSVSASLTGRFTTLFELPPGLSRQCGARRQHNS